MVSLNELRIAYSAAIANGLTIAELAAALGMKENSLTQRLTGLRKDLKEKGATVNQVRAIFPPLRRKVSERTSSRDTFLAELLASVPARTEVPTEPTNEAPTEQWDLVTA
jgi:phage shock protein A